MKGSDIQLAQTQENRVVYLLLILKLLVHCRIKQDIRKLTLGRIMMRELMSQKGLHVLVSSPMPAQKSSEESSISNTRYPELKSEPSLTEVGRCERV